MSGKIWHLVHLEDLSKPLKVLVMSTLAGVLVVACSAAPPAPTAVPTKAPAPAAQPTAAPAAAPAAQPTAAPAAPTAAAAKKVDFPAKGKSITMILAQGAGGAADILARQLSPGLEKALGVPVEIVNKPGGANLMALTELANSKPDGYTIELVAQPTIFVSMLDPELKSTVSRKDIQAVANFEAHSNVLAARADSGFKTLKDMIDAAKAKPRSVRTAAPGKTGMGAMIGYMLGSLAQVDFAFVYFDSGAECLTAILGGNADWSALSPSVTLPQVKGGKMTALAVTGTEQHPDFPGVKTFKEQGYDLTTTNSQGFIAPAGTPKEIVDILSAAVKTAIEDPDVKNKMIASGNTPYYMNAAQLNAAWDDMEKLARTGLEVAAKN